MKCLLPIGILSVDCLVYLTTTRQVDGTAFQSIGCFKSRGRKASVNWKMTANTVLAQVVQKGHIFTWAARQLVLIRQTPCSRICKEAFDLSEIHA